MDTTTWKTQRRQRTKPVVIDAGITVNLADNNKPVDITAEFIPVVIRENKPVIREKKPVNTTMNNHVNKPDTVKPSKSCPRIQSGKSKYPPPRRLAYSNEVKVSKYDRNKVIRARPIQPAEPTCVWTTLVMLNDSYACGAAVVAKSLRDVKTKYPIWCMVTPCVTAGCVEFLRTVFDNVVVVELLSHAVTKMKTIKQNQIYGGWIHSSFTKWNIWNREYFPFDRVCLIDADMMFLENCDSLFTLQVPAATFASPWVYPYVKSTDGRSTGSHNPYYDHKAQRGLTHGQRVDHAKIRRGFSESILGLACMVMVQPDATMYTRMREILNARMEYGHVRCVSGFDEQLFADTILDTRTDVYHIHPRYNAIIGKIPWLEGHNPRTQQFYNGKPWHNIKKRSDITDSPWPDIHAWWKFADSVIADHPGAEIWFYSPEYLATNTDTPVGIPVGMSIDTPNGTPVGIPNDNNGLDYAVFTAANSVDQQILQAHANFINEKIAAMNPQAVGTDLLTKKEDDELVRAQITCDDAASRTTDDRMLSAWMRCNDDT